MYDTKIFWNWFVDNSEQLTMLADLADDKRQALLDEMQEKLEEYCPGLSYVLGESTPQGRKLTFSAEGDTDLFRYVVELCDNAPDVDWWDFVPFKQAGGTNLKVYFDKYVFETSKMHFQQLECEEEPEFIGLRVAVDPQLASTKNAQPANIYDDEDMQVGVYVTLEAMIGEFDCATLLGYLEVCKVPEEPFKSGFQPLDDFPQFVEWFKKKRDK